MGKLSRSAALQVLRSAGSSGDRTLFTRTYVENRISLQAANAEWKAGRAFAAFVEARGAGVKS